MGKEERMPSGWGENVLVSISNGICSQKKVSVMVSVDNFDLNLVENFVIGQRT